MGWWISTGCANRRPPPNQSATAPPTDVVSRAQPFDAMCRPSAARSSVHHETWLTEPAEIPSAVRSSGGCTSCTWFSSRSTGPHAAKAAEWSSTAGSPWNRKSPSGTCSMTRNGPTPSSASASAIAAARSSVQYAMWCSPRFGTSGMRHHVLLLRRQHPAEHVVHRHRPRSVGERARARRGWLPPRLRHRRPRPPGCRPRIPSARAPRRPGSGRPRRTRPRRRPRPRGPLRAAPARGCRPRTARTARDHRPGPGG